MPRLLLLGLAILALSGCGGAGARDDIRSVSESFQAALRMDDGAGGCALLTPALVEEIESQEGEPCRDALGTLQLDADRVAHVDAYITSGIATLTTGSVHYLGREPDGWRLSAIGCRPGDGDPAESPRDCEAEA